MFRGAILLAALVGFASCDYLGSIFEASIISAIRNGGVNATSNKGHAKNCDTSVASFDITWDPEPIVRGKTVTVAGYITFLTEDFVEGEIDIQVSVFRYRIPLKCSDLGVSSCKKGEKITPKPRIIKVPYVPVTQMRLNGKLKNKKTGHYILCADATIHFQ